jgi:H+-transporting ATPase
LDPSSGATSAVLVAGELVAGVLVAPPAGRAAAAGEWQVRDLAVTRARVEALDESFGRAGYKTLGVAVSVNGGVWEYVGTLPLLDPPREDSAASLSQIKARGVSVKMITGDPPVDSDWIRIGFGLDSEWILIGF